MKSSDPAASAFWEKDGIRQVGFWVTLIGESSQEITYMPAWDSMAERAKRSGASRVLCREVRRWMYAKFPCAESRAHTPWR